MFAAPNGAATTSGSSSEVENTTGLLNGIRAQLSVEEENAGLPALAFDATKF
jgi:hypothetical protein